MPTQNTEQSPPWNPDLYQKTWLFATLAHQEQDYGGYRPGQKINYLNHISSVAFEVINCLASKHPDNAGLKADLALQCALLHDTVEDTPFQVEDIEAEFGSEVAQGVLALTKNEALPKEERMTDSLTRIQTQGREIAMVKMADRICNLQRPPHYWNTEKMQSYQKEAQAILKALASAHGFLAQRLEEKIINYAQFWEN